LAAVESLHPTFSVEKECALMKIWVEYLLSALASATPKIISCTPASMLFVAVNRFVKPSKADAKVELLPFWQSLQINWSTFVGLFSGLS
jgi:hypothetical protein